MWSNHCHTVGAAWIIGNNQHPGISVDENIFSKEEADIEPAREPRVGEETVERCFGNAAGDIGGFADGADVVTQDGIVHCISADLV